MSKTYDGDVECPRCGKEQIFQFFRTLWIEDPDNRALIFDDRLHLFVCRHCGQKVHIDTSFLVTNVPGHFSVWYEPHPDPVIDEETVGYAAMFGEDSFYANAPRIADWEEFKETIEKFERGELVGNPATKMDLSAAFATLGLNREPREKRGLGKIFGRLFGGG